MAAPTVTGVRFTSTQQNGQTQAQINVTWQAPAGQDPNYTISLFQDGNFLVKTSAIGSFGVLTTTTITYNTTSLYTIQVADYQNTSSAPVEVIVTPPTDLVLRYDGKIISATWKSPAGRASVSGGIMMLYLGTSIIQSNSAAGISGTLTPSPALDPNKAYTLGVQATYGVSSGPVGTLVAVIQSRPQISAVCYDMGMLQATATASQASSTRLDLFVNHTLWQTQVSPGLQVSMQPVSSLASWNDYTVTLTGALTDPGNPNTVISSGPISDPVPVLTAAPVIQEISFDDGQTVSVSWTNTPDTPTTTGGIITLLAGQNIVQSASANGTNGILTPSPPLQPTDQRMLKVQTTRWISVGPSSQSLALITARPEISSITYDGHALFVQWSAVSGQSITYMLALYAGDMLLQNQEASVLNTVLEVVLDPRQTYNVRVKACSGKISGPYGNAQTVLVAVPGIQAVTTLPSAIAVTIDTSQTTGKSGVAGYQALLYREQTLLAGPTVASGNPPGVQFPLSSGLQPQHNYSVRAQATGSNANALAGPLSTGVEVIVGQTQFRLCTYDGTKVSLEWLQSLHSSVRGYVVSIFDTTTGIVVSGPDYVDGTTHSLALNSPVSSHAYQARVQRVGGVATGLISSIPVIIQRTQLTNLRYDGTTVYAQWNAAPNATGYRMSIVSGNQPVASTLVNATGAALDIPATGENLAVQVSLISSISQGPASTSANILTAIPLISKALTDPVMNATTLSWGAVSGAHSYSVQLYADGQPTGNAISVAATSYQLPQPLLPAANQAASVAAVISSGTTPSQGPFSPLFALPTGQPQLLSADYNGSQITAEWTPVSGATGYRLSILANGVTQPVYQTNTPANVTHSAFTYSLSDPSKTYSLVVQALVDQSSGLSSHQTSLFSFAFFLSTASPEQFYPYIFPASALNFAPIPLTLYLPSIGGATPLSHLPLTQGAFTLNVNTDPASASAFPYALTIPANSSVWNFSAAPLRQSLQDDYVTFLKNAESLAGVIPWGISLMQQSIARVLPQTFQEQLYYSYGFDLAKGTADLRPGMVLQISFDDYTFVEGSPTPAWLKGYIGGSVIEYDVSSYLDNQGAWSLGFDAFIAQLVINEVMQVSAPPSSVSDQTVAGVADAADLLYPAFRQPFYRLFFPPQLQSSTGIGSVIAANNFVLAAAPSYTALNSTVNSPTAGNAITYFRGRAVVRLGIRVWINGVEEVVLLGTTASNILERYAQQPPSTNLELTGLRLERPRGPAVLTPDIHYAVNQTYCVRLDWQTLPVYGTARDALSLPLLHGDRLTIGAF